MPEGDRASAPVYATKLCTVGSEPDGGEPLGPTSRKMYMMTYCGCHGTDSISTEWSAVKVECLLQSAITTTSKVNHYSI